MRILRHPRPGNAARWLSRRRVLAGRTPSKGGHRPPQEIIKQWNREGRLTGRWAVDHAPSDQPASKRTHGFHLGTAFVRDFPGSMGSGAELCHHSQVFPFRRCQPIEAHAKEIAFEFPTHEWRRAFKVCADWRNCPSSAFRQSDRGSMRADRASTGPLQGHDRDPGRSGS